MGNIKETKSKLLVGVLFIITTIFAGWNIYKQQNEVKLSEMALANIEALAQDESWGEGIVVKECYTEFSGYDSNIYLTCSQYSPDESVKYPCGAATSLKPAWGFTKIGYFYIYV